MKSVTKTATVAVLSACLLVLGVPSLWANDPSYGHAGSGHGAGGSHGYGKGMMHSGTGHLIRHLLKHEKDIGLSGDQVAKLKEMQLNLDRVRIKAEADIQIAEREVKALTAALISSRASRRCERVAKRGSSASSGRSMARQTLPQNPAVRQATTMDPSLAGNTP